MHKQLRYIGLIPKALICDQGSSNRKFLKHVSPNSDTIYLIYDPPHLIKNVWNNFIRNTLSMGGDDIRWDHLAQFFEFDEPQ